MTPRCGKRARSGRRTHGVRFCEQGVKGFEKQCGLVEFGKGSRKRSGLRLSPLDRLRVHDQRPEGKRSRRQTSSHPKQ